LFDLNITKILILGVIGLLIFGPDQLPKMAAQAGQALRELRRLADRARADLTDNLGPEFSDFDFNDLNPRHFVRKHLLDDPVVAGDGYDWDGAAEVPIDADADFASVAPALDSGEIPPYDSEAT
jgi:sec-independent protein translocase protein TatB